MMLNCRRRTGVAGCKVSSLTDWDPRETASRSSASRRSQVGRKTSRRGAGRLTNPSLTFETKRQSIGCRRHPREGRAVAKRTIIVSDLSGETISEGKAATITIRFADARKGVYVLDVSEREAEDLGAKGRKQARRGRPPKTGDGNS